MAQSRQQKRQSDGLIAILIILLVAGGLYFFTGNGGEGNELPWKPAATNSEGKLQWVDFEMPPPIEFHSYSDCINRINSFISDTQRNYHGFKSPIACSYSSNSRIDAYITNLFYDGTKFYCLSKTVLESSTDKIPLYGMAIVWPGQPTSGDHWYCVNRL